MINKQLLQPESIVVIGGSNNVHKPGGAVVRNLLSGGYEGTLRVVNPKEDEVQGIKAFHDARELPPTDLAILVVAAKYCPDYVELLAKEKQEGAQLLLKMRKSWGDGALVQSGQMLSPEKWNTSVDAMEDAVALEKSLNQALLDLHSLGRARADVQLCEFLERRFLEEEMMLLEKMGDHLANLRKITSLEAGLQAGVAEYLFEKLSFQCD